MDTWQSTARCFLVTHPSSHTASLSLLTWSLRVGLAVLPFHLSCSSVCLSVGSRNGYSVERRQLSQWEANRQQTACDYRVRFCGHCNTHTDIKEASFLGERGEYVAAGSDDGNIFIWEKLTGNLVRVLHGDDSIVNCVQWHPQMAMLATSGIESVVRLWQPCCDRPHSDKVVEDAFKVCKANQQRMKMDPFEIMLMRMGLRMAMIGDELQAAVPEGGPQEGGGAFLIEQSGRCRQS